MEHDKYTNLLFSIACDRLFIENNQIKTIACDQKELMQQCTSIRQTNFHTTKSEYAMLTVPEILDESLEAFKHWLTLCFSVTRRGVFRFVYRWPFSHKHLHIPNASMNEFIDNKKYIVLLLADKVVFDLTKLRFTHHGHWTVDGTLTEYRVDYYRFKELVMESCFQIRSVPDGGCEYVLTD